MYNSFINTLIDHKKRHIPYSTTLRNWIKNCKKRYTVIEMNEISSKFKTSDTIFILGSGESINNVTPQQWQHIRQHDSFGLNFWPLHSFTPTYYHSEYMSNHQIFNYYIQTVAPHIKKRYRKTLFFISGNRDVTRGIHPRIVPELFPENPSVCFYTHKEPIRATPEEFSCASFKKTLFYRGSLTQTLDLMNQADYKKIVMVGVDLNNHIQFYDQLPEVQWCFETGYRIRPDTENPGIHGTMIPKPNKMTSEQYIYILNDLYYKPNNIKLYIASEQSRLAEKIPIYNFTD